MKHFTLSLLLALSGALSTFAQTTAEKKADKAAAYYNFAMGHLYAELAANYGNRGEYLTKAIDHYKAAIKADPSAGMLIEELSELYIQSGKLRDAVVEIEEGIRNSPDDLNLRRLLGRIYVRLIGDTQNNRVNEEMLKKAIEQYTKIVEKSPQDGTAWMMLGRLYKVSQNSPESERSYKKALEINPDNDEALTGLAMVYADVGDTKAAAELLRKASEKSPSIRTLVALAAAYEQLRDHVNAAATLRKALDLQPQNPEIKRGLAQNLLMADNYDEALRLFQEISEEDPKDAQSQLRISQIYRQQRKFDLARAAAKKASDLDPNSIEIRYNEVSLLEAEGKTDEAIEVMKNILSTTSKRNYSAGERSNRAILLERLGYLQRSGEYYLEAIESFKQMQQLDEEAAPRAAVHIIETHRLARDVNKAFEEAKAAKDKYPKDRAVQSMYAFMAADAGKGAEAERTVKELFKDKKDRESWITLAQVYERTKNYGEMGKALDEAEKLSESKEEKEGIYFMRGAMLEKQKKHDAAEAEFRKVLAGNPNSASALNYLGYMLADRNVKLNEAYDMIKKALDQEPGNGAYLDSLGWVLYRQGKLSDAEKYLKMAVEKTAKDPTVHDHLADVYFKQGKVKEAITHWQKSLQEWQLTPASEQDTQEIAKIQKKMENARVRLAREGKQ